MAKLFGWGNPTDSIEQTRYLSRSAFDTISSTDARFMSFSLDSEVQRLMGWEITRKVIGKDTENYPQLTGSCTAFGAKNAIEYLQCAEIYIQKDQEEFKPLYLPYIWGATRKTTGYNRKGEGAFGSTAAKAVMDYGTIPVEPDLPKVTQQIEYDWSGPERGVWRFEKYSNIGRNFQVKSTARITKWTDLVSAICNGYFCTIASDQGFEEMKPRSDGFHYPVGNWAHQQCIIGADNTYKEPYGIILNSWGDVHGKLKDFTTGEDLPIGVLRVRAEVIERMMQDECFVYSNYNGFPARKLTRNEFNTV